jgi:hypothetical protein
MDSNFPEVTLTMAALILGAADRVRWDNLEVVPDEGVDKFELDGDTLRVPGFGLIGGKLLYAAATGGVEDAGVVAYLDSIMGLVSGDDGRLAGLRRHRRVTGCYPTTEAEILKGYAPDDGGLSEEYGLRLVLEACDELEVQVSRLGELPRREGEPADVS